MAYKVAGIDIHKRVLMVVVATAADHVNAEDLKLGGRGARISHEPKNFHAATGELKIDWTNRGPAMGIEWNGFRLKTCLRGLTPVKLREYSA